MAEKYLALLQILESKRKRRSKKNLATSFLPKSGRSYHKMNHLVWTMKMTGLFCVTRLLIGLDKTYRYLFAKKKASPTDGYCHKDAW